MKITISDLETTDLRTEARDVMAEFSVIFDDEFKVHGLKLEQEGGRVFVTMPGQISGERSQHIFQPLSDELLERIRRAALRAYRREEDKCSNNTG